MRGCRAPAHWTAALLVLGALGAGCAPDRDDLPEVPEGLERPSGLTPTYEPASTTTALAGAAASSTTTTEAPDASGGTTVPARRPTSSLTDPTGDATALIDGAPAWADLAGGTVTRNPSHYELRVRLAEAAPTSSGSADHTFNVAAFFDVDGDGAVDFELWANLADGGWDGAWFDDDSGRAAYSDHAAMDVLVVDGELVVRFPPEYVGGAEAFRWSLASEYGTYLQLGTPSATRDDAPDDGALTFPA